MVSEDSIVVLIALGVVVVPSKFIPVVLANFPVVRLLVAVSLSFLVHVVVLVLPVVVHIVVLVLPVVVVDP